MTDQFVGVVPPSAVDRFADALPPAGLDPLADGILMQHQKDWVADTSPLKLCAKGRRTGITFAEALDSTLIASTARSAGGDNTFYIGDTKDKGLEFIAVCARFAQHVAKELLQIEEYLFDDVQEDGSSRYISGYRIKFASGFQIAALSSRPANIRGLQGRVIIDEAAFHVNVRAVLDAVNALLIWGGVIRIISTHNGQLNAFAELIKETREGKYDYKIHEITFDDAVRNGLYERVCLIRGWKPSAKDKSEWYRRIRRSYGTRVEAMREELDAVPREGDGTFLPLALIEACSTADYKVLRWAPPSPQFVDWSETVRRATMLEWLEREVAPALATLPKLPMCIGEDFGMRNDRTDIAIGYVGQDLKRHVPLIIELRQCPYDQQRQALFWIGEHLYGFQGGLLDANGNGMALAQEARQKFGAERVIELIASDAWYREHMPRFGAAFEDGTILIPADLDVRNDLRQIRTANGISKVPSDVRTVGTDGGKRHADSAVAIINLFVATHRDVIDYGYTKAPRAGRLDDRPDDDRRRRPPFGQRDDGGFRKGAW